MRGVDYEQMVQEILKAAAGNVIFELLCHVIRQNAFVRVADLFGLVRGLAHRHLVNEAAERPHICLEVVTLRQQRQAPNQVLGDGDGFLVDVLVDLPVKLAPLADVRNEGLRRQEVRRAAKRELALRVRVHLRGEPKIADLEDQACPVLGLGDEDVLRL